MGHNYLWQRLALHRKNIEKKTHRKHRADVPDSAYYNNTFFPKIQENFCEKLRLAEKKYV